MNHYTQTEETLETKIKTLEEEVQRCSERPPQSRERENLKVRMGDTLLGKNQPS